MLVIFGLMLILGLMLWLGGGVTVNLSLTLIVEPAETSNFVNVTTRQPEQKCLTP